jgi:hypothetical protein
MCKVNSGLLFIKVFIELVLVIRFHLVIFIIIVTRIVLILTLRLANRQVGSAFSRLHVQDRISAIPKL